MAASGNWFPNILNLWIGSIIGGFWAYLGGLLAVFGMAQVPADAILAALTEFKPTDLTTKVFTTAMTLN